jgi:hypothetical protein
MQSLWCLQAQYYAIFHSCAKFFSFLAHFAEACTPSTQMMQCSSQVRVGHANPKKRWLSWPMLDTCRSGLSRLVNHRGRKRPQIKYRRVLSPGDYRR